MYGLFSAFLVIVIGIALILVPPERLVPIWGNRKFVRIINIIGGIAALIFGGIGVMEYLS